jgi:hypothetical protein
MTTINDGGSAFPTAPVPTWLDQKREMWALRDWFATHATDADIAAILNPPHGAQNISRYEARYIHADAMLRAREVKP